MSPNEEFQIKNQESVILNIFVSLLNKLKFLIKLN